MNNSLTTAAERIERLTRPFAQMERLTSRFAIAEKFSRPELPLAVRMAESVNKHAFASTAFELAHAAFNKFNVPDIPASVMKAMELANFADKFKMPDIPARTVKAWELSNLATRFHMPELPTNIAYAIESIRVQHERYAGFFSGMDKAMSTSIALAQASGLHTALAMKTDWMVNRFALAGRWQDIEVFEDINEGIADWGDQIADKEYITKEDFDEFKAFITEKISSIGKDAIGHAMIWMTILGFLYSILSEYRYQNQSQAITAETFNTFRAELLQAVKDTVKDRKEYRVVNRKCRVYLKPKLKSYIVTQADSGLALVILQNHHKWAYVSFIDPTDTLAQTGWILRKYLK